MGKRWIRISLVVGGAFAFTITCSFLARKAPSSSFVVDLVTALLMYPGFAITGLCFGRSSLGESRLAFVSAVAFDTLIYSVIFGLPVLLVHRLSKSD